MRFSSTITKTSAAVVAGAGAPPAAAAQCERYAMRNFWIVAIVCLLAGCASPQPKPFVDVETRVDPRLLEQTDKAAPPEAVERAKAFHQTSKDAARFPVFQRARILEHGGYSARFGPRSESIACVVYFFDAQGNYLAKDRWICDGY